MLSNNLKNHIRTRPRFEYKTSLSKKEFLTHLLQYFKKKNKTIGGYINEEMCIFNIRSIKDSMWSPHLQIRVEEDEFDNLTYVRGMFGPKPSVWTLFMFLYFGCLFLSFFSFIAYFATLKLDNYPIFLWLGIFFIVMVFVLFNLSKIGQLGTKNQMRLLKTFILMVLKAEDKKL